MPANTRLIENQKVVPISVPKSYSSATNASVWLNLKNYEHATFVIYTGAWAAATANVTLLQAQDVSGTGSKALAFSWMWVNTTALPDTYTKTAVTSNTFSLGTANLTYVIEIDSSDLDVSNLFDCVSLAIGSPGANADFYAAIAVLGSQTTSRYPGASLPSCLVN